MTSEEYITVACLAVVAAAAASIVAPALAVVLFAVFVGMLAWSLVQGAARVYLAITGSPPSSRGNSTARGGE